MTEEVKRFKVGEYGQPLYWVMTYEDGEIVKDLDQADSVTLYMDLNSKITSGEMTIIGDVTEGKVMWRIPEGALDSPGIAYFEVEAKYTNRMDITNTFSEVIEGRVKK